MKITRYLRENPLALLVLALPLAILAEVGQWGATWVFTLSALGVIPMARFIGEATEALAVFTGPALEAC
jgi:Ca2+:H+ antiporter